MGDADRLDLRSVLEHHAPFAILMTRRGSPVALDPSKGGGILQSFDVARTMSRTAEEGDAGSIVALGRAAWPPLRVDPVRFAAHVEAITAAHGAPLSAHAGDLYLAFACATGVRGAHETFDARYAPTLARAAFRAAKSNDVADEAAQALRVKLFVDVPPKILDYRGRAKLSTWLATAAARTALNVLAAREDRDGESLHTGDARAVANPELDFVRAKYGAAMAPALVDALAKLSDKDRAILRLHFVERMSIDALGEVYRVGRSTAARWLSAAREALLEHCRAELRGRFEVTPSELRSIGADLESKLEASLLRHL